MMEKLSKYYLEILKLLAKGEKGTEHLLLINYKSSLIDIKKTLGEYLHRYEDLSFQEWLRVDRLKSLVNQINDILDNTYKTNEALINSHVKESYSKIYNGLFYQLEVEKGLILDFTMIDAKSVEKAIQMPIDGLRLSERLYDKHLHSLKLKTKGAITRGLIDGSGYRDIAADISNIGVADYKQALRIAITEGNRLRSLAREDSYQEASKLGIGLKKRWLSTLDHKTRDTHRALDSVTIGIDEEFEIRGYKALQPRLFGVASEDIHCRCDTIPIVEGISPSLRRDNITGDVIKYKDYNQWYREKASSEQSFVVKDKKYKNRFSDKKLYEKYKEILGKEVPKSFDKFKELKYNNVNEWNLFKDYVKSRSSNMISAFSSFKDYKKYRSIIDDEIVGILTSNGIKITGQSKHFIERVLGTSKDPKTGRPRNGVEVSDIKEALLKGTIRIRKSDPNSIKFVTDKCMVSINPNTGILIQANP